MGALFLILFLAAVGSFMSGLYSTAIATTVLHQIIAGLSFLTSAILFVGAFLMAGFWAVDSKLKTLVATHKPTA